MPNFGVADPNITLNKNQCEKKKKKKFLIYNFFFFRTVIETLKTVDQDRKCFRLIGGVLCERTVKEVLPQLVENKDFIEKTITMVTEDLSKKGQQINKFKEENNIKIRGEQMANETQNSKEEEDKKSENRNVLVSN